MQKVKLGASVCLFAAMGLLLFISLPIDFDHVAEHQAEKDAQLLMAHGYPVVLMDSPSGCAVPAAAGDAFVWFCLSETSPSVLWGAAWQHRLSVEHRSLQFQQLVQPYIKAGQPGHARRAATRLAMLAVRDSVTAPALKVGRALPPLSPPASTEIRDATPSGNRKWGMLVMLAVLAVCTALSSCQPFFGRSRSG